MAEIKLDRVDKIYSGGVKAVDGLDLTIEDGEFIALVGPSGCGKSTLLRMIAGLEEITDGDVSIGGQVVNAMTPRERNIAMVFQSYALYPHMTVAQNMGFNLKLSGETKQVIEQRVNEAARMVNRGGRICLAAFPGKPAEVDIAHIVRNNIYVFGIRGEGKSATHRAEAFMAQKRFDATKVHTHTFALEDLPTALKYARERIEDAIKVVVKTHGHAALNRVAAE